MGGDLDLICCYGDGIVHHLSHTESLSPAYCQKDVYSSFYFELMPIWLSADVISVVQVGALSDIGDYTESESKMKSFLSQDGAPHRLMGEGENGLDGDWNWEGIPNGCHGNTIIHHSDSIIGMKLEVSEGAPRWTQKNLKSPGHPNQACFHQLEIAKYPAI